MSIKKLTKARREELKICNLVLQEVSIKDNEFTVQFTNGTKVIVDMSKKKLYIDHD